MKLFFRSALFAILLFCSSGVYAEKVPVVMAYESTDLVPYYFGKSVIIPAKAGAAIDLIRLTDKKISEVEFYLVRHTWSQCLKLLEEGKVDAVFPGFYTDERNEYAKFPMKKNKLDKSRMMFSFDNSVYTSTVSKVQWDGKKFQNLKGAVSIPRDYAVGRDLEKMGIKVDNFAIDTRQAMLRMLTGKSEAAVLLDRTADDLIKKEPKLFKNVVKHKINFSSQKSYLLFSKDFYSKHPELSEKIWNVIKEVRENNLDEILKRYK